MASLIQLLLGRFSVPSAHDGMYGLWLDRCVSFSLHLSFFFFAVSEMSHASVNIMKSVELHFYSTAFNRPSVEQTTSSTGCTSLTSGGVTVT
jgi:hypothetical protein